MLDSRADAPAIDGIVHPCTALLASARIQIEVELPNLRAVAMEDVEKAHRRMPGRRAPGANFDAIERLDQPKEPRDDTVLRKVCAHFLVGARVARLFELFRRIREVPRFELRETKLVARECRELRVIAFGVGLRAAREIFEEGENFARILRHLRTD